MNNFNECINFMQMPFALQCWIALAIHFKKTIKKAEAALFLKFVLLHWRFLRHEVLCVGGVSRNCNSRSWCVPYKCERCMDLRHVIKHHGVGVTSIMQTKQIAVKKTFVLLSNYRNTRKPVYKQVVFVLVHSTDIYPYILAMNRVRAVSEVSTNNNLTSAPPTIIKLSIWGVKH